jgi:nucleoid DNA-binding protein
MQKNKKDRGPAQKPRRRNRHSNSFRDQIIRYLHDEKGFSWPKAERGFRAVFDVIAAGLQRGEVVKLPGLGKIKSVLSTKPQQRYWKPLWNLRTGRMQYRVVPRQRRPRRIFLLPDRGLDFTPPPSPPSAADMEARQLAAQLLGKDVVSDSVMHFLQQHGVEIRPHQPDALLRRLRELTNRGQHFNNEKTLAWAVAQLFWL